MTHPPFRSFRVDGLTFGLILVEGGTFLMGSDKSADRDAYDDETPAHRVAVPSFYLAQFPLTQVLWKAVTGENWEHLQFTGDNRPMERVSWDDVQDFLDKLERKTGTRFRLPGEAEWEYAARGGRYNSGQKYAGSGRLKEVGWYDDNSHDETKPSGHKFPNELGLYDMSGNVWEWCEDHWHDNYTGAPDDGSAWVDREQGSLRVRRGGGWFFTARRCRVAYRGNWNPVYRDSLLGFRLALSLQSVGHRPGGL